MVLLFSLNLCIESKHKIMYCVHSARSFFRWVQISRWMFELWHWCTLYLCVVNPHFGIVCVCECAQISVCTTASSRDRMRGHWTHNRKRSSEFTVGRRPLGHQASIDIIVSTQHHRKCCRAKVFFSSVIHSCFAPSEMPLTCSYANALSQTEQSKWFAYLFVCVFKWMAAYCWINKFGKCWKSMIFKFRNQ